MNTSQNVDIAFANQVLERCANLIYVYDLKAQRNVYANHELASVLGYTADEIQALGSTMFTQLMHPDDLAQLPAHHTRIMHASDGDVHTIDYRMRHKDGEWRWLVSRDTVFSRASDGTVQQYCGVVDDITQRRNTFEWAQRALSLTPLLVYVYDYTTQQNVYSNSQINALLGYTSQEILQFGSSLLVTLMHPDDFAALPHTHAEIVHATDTDTITTTYRMRRKDGAWAWLQDTVRVFLRTPNGAVQQYMGAIQDVTLRRHEDDERQVLQQQVIDAQQTALRELSTPVIPVSDDVLVLPLIGSIDAQRAQMVLESLLDGVTIHRAQMVILDITGVPFVDTQVAGAVLRAAQAVKLLGAEIILTGIRPEVAQTLITLGIDFQGIVTLSTLQRGIAHALRA